MDWIEEADRVFRGGGEASDDSFVYHTTAVRTVVVDAGTIGTTDFNLTARQENLLIRNVRGAAKTLVDTPQLPAGFRPRPIWPSVRRSQEA